MASLAGSAHAQQLTENDAVERALTVAPLVAAWETSIDRREALALVENVWPNPTLGYTREQSFEDPVAIGEDLVVLEQTLPLSGRRAIETEIARRRADVARLENRAEGLEIANEVRTIYYRLLLLERRSAVYASWLETMAELEGILERRIEAGESAPYELERIQKEIADVAAERAVARAEAARRRAELEAFTGLAGAWKLAGELMPPPVPDDEALRELVSSHPDVIAASARAEVARLRERSAARWWVPEPTITAGYRRADVGGDSFHGFVAGVSIPLPFSNQTRPDSVAASAERVHQAHVRELTERRLAGRIIGLARHVRGLKAAARQYETAGIERAERVVETARLAYLGGELGILELIDAYRGLVDAQLKAVEIAAAARGAEIELRSSLPTAGPDDRSARR